LPVLVASCISAPEERSGPDDPDFPAFGTAKLLNSYHICKKNTHICKKNAEKFGYVKKKQYFCTRFSKNKHSAWSHRDVNQRSVCGPKSESTAKIHMSDVIANRIEP
jgi:hypothetical protein